MLPGDERSTTMGATTAYRVYQHNDREKIKKSWIEEVNQADYEDGHDPYNGSINQLGKTITRWHDLRLASEDAAEEKLHDLAGKRDPAIAVSFLIARVPT